MTTIMTIAVGVAIGYFLYQYFVSNGKGQTHGRIHKSASDKNHQIFPIPDWVRDGGPGVYTQNAGY